jgi:hypothetical protein
MKEKAFVHPDYYKEKEPSIANAGFGFGVDYGGILGTKVNVIPYPWLGLFGAVGLSYQQTGYAVGMQFRMPTEKKTSFYVTGLWGDNAGYVSEDRTVKNQYKGFSVGGGIELKRKSRKSFWAFGLLVPFRDPQLLKDVDALMSQGIKINYTDWPLTLTLGIHFMLDKE